MLFFWMIRRAVSSAVQWSPFNRIAWSSKPFLSLLLTKLRPPHAVPGTFSYISPLSGSRQLAFLRHVRRGLFLLSPFPTFCVLDAQELSVPFLLPRLATPSFFRCLTLVRPLTSYVSFFSPAFCPFLLSLRWPFFLFTLSPCG